MRSAASAIFKSSCILSTIAVSSTMRCRSTAVSASSSAATSCGLAFAPFSPNDGGALESLSRG